MKFVGQLVPRLCGHGSARPPDTIGHYPRTCPTCRTQHTLIIEQSEDLTQRCGRPVLRARWATEPKDTAA